MNVETKEFTLLTPFSIEKAADVVDNTSDKIIKISGCANFSGLDENGKTYSDLVNDIVVPHGMDTSVYALNPQILLQHDRNKTVGRALTVEKRTDGIYITAEIHADAMSAQDFYRVKSGLICMYSLGFKTRKGEWKKVDNKEVWYITDSLLLECSLVSIPANSKSGFSVLVKSLNDEGFTSEVIKEKDAEPTNHKEDDPMKITVKRADLLSATDLEKFKALGGDVEADVEISLADFIKDSVAKEVAAILAAKEAEAVAAAEVAKTEALAAETAKAEAEALAQAEALVQEEKEFNDELFVLKELVETLTAAIATEEN